MSVRSPETVVGVDLSLTSTGLARITRLGQSDQQVVTGRVKPKMKGFERLDFILNQIHQWTHDADLVVLEGLAFTAHDTNRQGAGLHWMLRHGLWKGEVPTALCPPMVRAKFATGKGNAGKDEVLSAVIRRYAVPLDIDVPGNDVADALTLAAMGARRLGFAIEMKLIGENAASAMDKVEWPST